MSTLYEIHITVELKTGIDEIKWIYFCNDNKYKRIRVLNDKGGNNVQNMISKWCSRNTDDEAIKKSGEIAKKIKENGFKITRVKVEGMMMNKLFDNKVLKNEKGIYWEFHFKIASRTLHDFNRIRYWKKLNALSNNIGLSLSDSGNTKYPIITIRLHSGSREDAINIKDKIVTEIKNMDLHIHDKLQAECSIYDTYPEEDDGWFN